MDGSAPGFVRLDVRGTAGWIVLDRHERRNALNGPMILGIEGGIARFAADPGVRCVILASTGTAFCAGADLGDAGNGATPPGIRIYARAARAILGSPKPVLARVQGPAVAGGVGLVAACHLAVGAEAARFSTPEVRSGLYPLMVHALIEATVGRKRAFSLGLLGVELDAGAALGAGLLHEVVPACDLDRRIDELSAAMAGIPPDVMGMALGALHSTAGMDAIARIDALQESLNRLDDAR